MHEMYNTFVLCRFDKRFFLHETDHIHATVSPLAKYLGIFRAHCLVVNSNKNEQDCSAVISVKNDDDDPLRCCKSI